MPLSFTSDQFSNFAASTIAGGSGGAGTTLGSSDTTLLLGATTGALFPAAAPFSLVIGPTTSTPEIVLCTARSSDSLTIVRAQENTLAGSWAVGTTVQHVWTAGNATRLWSALQATAAALQAAPLIVTGTAPATGVNPLFGGQVSGDTGNRAQLGLHWTGYGRVSAGAGATSTARWLATANGWLADNLVQVLSTSLYAGTYTGGYTLGAAGPFADGAVTFNGTSSYVSLPTTGIFTSPGSAYSLETLVYLSALPSATAALISLGTNVSNELAELQLDSAGRPQLITNGNSTTTTTALATGSWHHLVATYDGGVLLAVYLDGTHLSGDSASGITRATTFGNARLGAGVDGARFLGGRLARAAIYPFKLSSTQVNAHYAALATDASTYDQIILGDRPVRYYPLTETSGTSAANLRVALQAGNTAGLIADSGWLTTDGLGALSVQTLNTAVALNATAITNGGAAINVTNGKLLINAYNGGTWIGLDFGAGVNLSVNEGGPSLVINGGWSGTFNTGTTMTLAVGWDLQVTAGKGFLINQTGSSYDGTIQSSRDLFLTASRNLVLAGTIAGTQSATAPALATAGTITATGLSVSRIAPVGAVTGVILQAGTVAGQRITVLNESTFSVTFDVAGTSNVADGASDVIAATTARDFIWDSVTALWYRKA